MVTDVAASDGAGPSVGRVAAAIGGAAAAGTLVVVALGRAAGFGDLRETLGTAEPGWLAVCAVGQVLVFAGYAGVVRTAIAPTSGRSGIPLGLSLRIVLATFAATQLFGFGGAGGLVVMYWVVRRYGRDRRRAVVELLGMTTAVYLVFGVLGWFAAVATLVTAGAPLPMTLPWIAGIPVVIAAAGWFTAPGRHVRWTGATAGRWTTALGTGVAAAVWVRHRLVRRDGRRVFGWAALYWAGDLVSLWAALQAFGGQPAVAAVVAAYTTGYLVQSLPLPMLGTAGVDTATTLLLHVVGVPLEVALLAVVAHRLFAFWLPVVPGAVLAVTLPRRLPDPDDVVPAPSGHDPVSGT